MIRNEHGQPVGEDVAGWTTRPPAAPTLLEGRTVRLEALAERHADDLWTALVEESPDALWTYLPYGPFAERTAFDAHVARLEADSALAPLAVVVEGRAAGVSAYLREDRAHGCVEVGHVALGARLQRTTAATEATYLMMRHVLDERDGLGYRRFEWKCDALNAPSRHAAERFGFTFEGVFRQDKVVKGRSRDTAWFSVVDHEWPRLRAAYENWLAASNFDEGGAQRRSLRDLREATS
ncbi:N-acetyltransferase [Marmoricola endophyticus]|uniref:N-acetyltransferase n=1 Tax=Marmoricola endophyticus TaxID=2040280 RepID=A0A917BH59_9ACTN|nr:GNAT family protein [Marmoricola endophyticus]GGF39629.1 N-acetyltransferase [Marmoricola endophyticus]